jgi:hypothetical protein
MKRSFLVFILLILISCKKSSEIYVVKKGDTLSQIAQRKNISLEELRIWNGIDGNQIFPGQKLIVEFDRVTLEEIPFDITSAELSSLVQLPAYKRVNVPSLDLEINYYQIPAHIEVDMDQIESINAFASFYFFQDSLAIVGFGGKFSIKNKENRYFEDYWTEGVDYDFLEFIEYLESLGFKISKNDNTCWKGVKENRKFVSYLVREGYPDEPYFLIHKNNPAVKNFIDSTNTFGTKELAKFMYRRISDEILD